MKKVFGFYVNLDERGEFSADVRDVNENSIYEIEFPCADDEMSLIEAGYMKNPRDISGLTDYLRQVGMIGSEDRILESREFESHLASIPNAASQSQSLNELEVNIAAAIRARETLKIGGGLFKTSELIPIHAMLNAHSTDSKSPLSDFTDEQREDIQTFLANLGKAIFDRETISIAGGDFVRSDLQALKIFITEQLEHQHTESAGPSI